MINADEKYRVLSADGFDSALEQQLRTSLDVNLYKTDLEIVFPYRIIKSNNGNFDMIRIIITGTFRCVEETGSIQLSGLTFHG